MTVAARDPAAPSTGRWIDVDVTRYVVKLMNGVDTVQTIAPVAVGEQVNTGAYESTQTGLFHVYNKIAGLQWDAPYSTYIADWVGFDAAKANGIDLFLVDKDGRLLMAARAALTTAVSAPAMRAPSSITPRSACRSTSTYDQAMPDFETMGLPQDVTVYAPDGGEVRVLLALEGGSFAHFALEPGKTSIAVTHRTVEEIGTSSPGTARCGANRANAKKSLRWSLAFASLYLWGRTSSSAASAPRSWALS